MISKPTSVILLSTLGLSSGSVINPRQSVTIPPACNVIPAWEVTYFNWFNSSDNLDCVSDVNVPKVCSNSTPSGVPVGCDGNLGPCDFCGKNACGTGMPLQPAGYGPPDNVTISIPSVIRYDWCFESNPQSIRRAEVGDGIMFCGGAGYHIGFVGDSNEDVGTGHITFSPNTKWACSNGSTITAKGSVDFEIACTRDSGNNATCVIPAGETVTIPVLAYTIT